MVKTGKRGSEKGEKRGNGGILKRKTGDYWGKWDKNEGKRGISDRKIGNYGGNGIKVRENTGF